MKVREFEAKQNTIRKKCTEDFLRIRARTPRQYRECDICNLSEMGSLVLIFVETKRSANDLSYFLSRSGLSSVPIHGDLKQYERERNLDMFKSGQCPVLVATAVAARGLDIPNVRHGKQLE